LLIGTIRPEKKRLHFAGLIVESEIEDSPAQQTFRIDAIGEESARMNDFDWSWNHPAARSSPPPGLKHQQITIFRDVGGKRACMIAISKHKID